MSWFSDNAWAAWLGLALILGAIEVISVDFVFVMLAGGAVAGSVAAVAGAQPAGQVIAAVVVATALLLVVRPMVRRHFAVPEGHGEIGASDGRVKLGGETWSARTAPDAAACLPGQEVRVVNIEGATAIVSNVVDGQKPE